MLLGIIVSAFVVTAAGGGSGSCSGSNSPVTGERVDDPTMFDSRILVNLDLAPEDPVSIDGYYTWRLLFKEIGSSTAKELSIKRIPKSQVSWLLKCNDDPKVGYCDQGYGIVEVYFLDEKNRSWSGSVSFYRGFIKVPYDFYILSIQSISPCAEAECDQFLSGP